MPTDILLVRHGQTQSNFTGYYMGWSDEDLNETGAAQAQCLSARLSDLQIASIYSSPLQRAYSTAKIIDKPHGLEVKLLQDLTEINFGDWQGLHVTEIKQRWPELWQEWHVDPSQVAVPGGENFSQIAERVSRALRIVIADNLNARSIIVAHEIVIKIVIMQVLGASFSVYRHFEIGNASLSRIQVYNDWLRLITVNDKSHLEG